VAAQQQYTQQDAHTVTTQRWRTHVGDNCNGGAV